MKEPEAYWIERMEAGVPDDEIKDMFTPFDIMRFYGPLDGIIYLLFDNNKGRRAPYADFAVKLALIGGLISLSIIC